MLSTACVDAAICPEDRDPTARLFIPLPKQWRRQIKQALLHAIGLERLALSEVRAGFEHSSDPRAQMAAEIDRLREHIQTIQTLQEELRIKHARLCVIPPLKRPHYPPLERLAILILKARMGWSAAETARRFGVTAATILSWMKRLDDQGPDALVQTAVPVNKFDDSVTLLAHQLHQAAPRKGRTKLAALFGRAGCQLAASTVRRMLKKAPPKLPGPEPEPKTKTESSSEHGQPKRVVTAREPHQLWHVDISTIAIGAPGTGFWAPWWPFALVLRWVLSWHMAFVLDHLLKASLGS